MRSYTASAAAFAALAVAAGLSACTAQDGASPPRATPSSIDPSPVTGTPSPAEPSASTAPSVPGSGMTSGPAVPPRPPRSPLPPLQTPTDTVSTAWIAGTVTATSRGSCYNVITDDGVAYALYYPRALPVRRGERVRAHIGPLRIRIYCGTGQHASADQLIPVR
jgi:hypothetical protein